jgi:hypothetical protein
MLQIIILQLIGPVALAVVALYVGRQRWASRVVVMWAVAVALIASWMVSDGVPSWPFSERWHGVFYFVVTTAIIAGLAKPRTGRRGVGVAAVTVGVLAVAFLSFPGLPRASLYAPILSIFVYVLETRLRDARPGHLAAVVVPMTACAILLGVARFATLALPCGAAAVAGLGAAVVVRTRCSLNCGIGFGGAWLVVLALTGFAYDGGHVPAWNWAAVAASPLWIAMLSHGSGTRQRLGQCVMIVTCLVAVCTTDVPGAWSYYMSLLMIQP